LMERHEMIGDFDLAGLFIGIEFVRDRESREPADTETATMLEFCVREGLLFEKGGYHHNRFQLIPPLTIEPNQIDAVIDVIDRALMYVESGGDKSGLPDQRRSVSVG
ncbi:MAG TPA: hypothetical protein VN880_07985, partial [Solirubrobacteraceae bacterium]|nr:hypothetical protein [Solirubrobacteraceae bacterium]